MRVLFDQGTPVPLRNHLLGHEVSTTYELGWSALQNGELILRADTRHYDVFVTTDQNIKHQHNLAAYSIAIVVLGAASWPRIQKALPRIVEAIDTIKRGGYIEIPVPHDL